MRPLALLCCTLMAVAGACGSDEPEAHPGAGERITVIASFYPLAEAARRVGSAVVQVVDLTPAGTEPHDLELSPDQVDSLEDADVVLYLGEGFQPAVEKVAERRDGPAIDLLADVDFEGARQVDDHAGEDDGEHAEEEEEAHAHGGEADPHFWLDPVRMAAAVDSIADTLAEVAPEHADTFAANTERYRAELEDLDGEFEAGLATCARRTIVTAHAAFHYLADRYDLEQLPISGLSPESEPDPRRVAELTDLIEREGVTTVFYETLVNPDVAQTLAREAKVETAVLNPLEGLTEDDVEAGKDYVAVMRDNLAALTSALGCG